MSNSLYRRDVSGIAITIAIHAGLAAALLLIVDQVVMPKAPPPPLIVQRIPEPTPTPPMPLRPQIRDLPVQPQVVAPTWEELKPPADKGFTAALPALGDGDQGLGAGIGSSDQPIELPAGPSRAPRFLAGGASQPAYPSASRRLGEEGAVVVAVSIDAGGAVTDVRLVTSSGFPRLDAAALEHARRRWRFEPALKDGQPVAAVRTITVSFRLAAG